MGTPRFLLAAVVLAVLVIRAPAADTKGFGTDYKAARAQAAATGRPLLLHFYADYCPPCRRMEAETFSDPTLQRQIPSLVVAVKVNTGTPAGREIARQYGVDLIPHDRLIAPDGSELRRAGGFIDKVTYLTMLQEASKRWLELKPKPVVPKAASGDTVVKRKAGEAISAAVPGLDGYCPVEIGLNRRWVRGKDAFVVEYKDIKYRISSKEHLDRFKLKPELYAPQVLGCDPVVLSKSQRAIPGKTSFGAFFDGKLYLFQSRSSRTTFKENPLKYTRLQHALKADKIERTVVR